MPDSVEMWNPLHDKVHFVQISGGLEGLRVKVKSSGLLDFGNFWYVIYRLLGVFVNLIIFLRPFR